jgi:hypothetical protein
MAFFPDLAPYEYGRRFHPGVFHVGWLDNQHPFPRGSVDPRLIARLRALAANPVELYRGFHVCGLCAEPSLSKGALTANRGNGEIRVSRGGITFAAPVLIVHYIEQHSYLPPAQFLSAVDEATL